MNTLADNAELDGSFTPEEVRDMLIDAVNLAWSQRGNNARCTVAANFIGWTLLENERLRVRVAELEHALGARASAAEHSQKHMGKDNETA